MPLHQLRHKSANRQILPRRQPLQVRAVAFGQRHSTLKRKTARNARSPAPTTRRNPVARRAAVAHGVPPNSPSSLGRSGLAGATGRRAGQGWGPCPALPFISPLPFPSCHRHGTCQALLAVRPYLATAASVPATRAASAVRTSTTVCSGQRFTSSPLDGDRSAADGPRNRDQALRPTLSAVRALCPTPLAPRSPRTTS